MNVRLLIGQIVYFVIGLASLATRVATKDEFDGCCGSHFPTFGSSPSIEAEDRPGIGSTHMRMTTLRLHHPAGVPTNTSWMSVAGRQETRRENLLAIDNIKRLTGMT
jgi:hypothetical protein